MVIICLVVVTVVVIVYGVFQCLSLENIMIFAPLDNKTYSYKKFLPDVLVSLKCLSSELEIPDQIESETCNALWKPYIILYKVHWSVKILYLFWV